MLSTVEAKELMEPIKKKKRTEGDAVSDKLRCSRRLVTHDQVLHDKESDGLDERREKGSLQAITGCVGEVPCRGGADQNVRTKVNHRKLLCRAGKELCHNKMKELGQAHCLCSLPVNVMRGLLQGWKSKSAATQFNKECKNLNRHNGTNCMFLHWKNEKKEAVRGEWQAHPCLNAREDLTTSIESLGNFVSNRLMFPDKKLEKQPGGLCNNRKHKNKAQQPHFDVTGWQGLPAKELPHMLHVPLCEEGMMMHVFPTRRNPATHNLGDDEKMMVGEPVIVHIAFGDALLLRADVAHGGCYGSKGNFRFHMMLRVENCPLETFNLHFLKRVADKRSYTQAMKEFSMMDWDEAFLDAQNVVSTIYAVRTYIEAVKDLCPDDHTWHKQLFDRVHHLQS
jgi:hypothetical protein